MIVVSAVALTLAGTPVGGALQLVAGAGLIGAAVARLAGRGPAAVVRRLVRGLTAPTAS